MSEPTQHSTTSAPKDGAASSAANTSGICFIIGGTAIAVANTGDGFHACTNTCPHAGGPLGEGELNGNVLTCPYHGWSFDLAEGTCLTNGDVELLTYDVKVVGDAVCVKL